MDYPAFKDFAEESRPLDGAKLKIDEILNQQVIVTGYNIRSSKYSKNKSEKCLTMQFKKHADAEPNILFTGSDVLIDQFEKYGEKIPFTTIIKKIDRYYTLS